MKDNRQTLADLFNEYEQELDTIRKGEKILEDIAKKIEETPNKE